MIDIIKNKVLNGYAVTKNDAIEILKLNDDKKLFNVAEEITKYYLGDKFDTCSIINAKNGNCSEDCKWCAQSAHYNTNIEPYSMVSVKECLEHAKYNSNQNIKRFALVTSGKKVSKKDLNELITRIKEIKKETPLKICASMGLLEYEDLKTLYEAGVENYHCNIETSPNHFGSLCTTHTLEEKMNTLKAAKKSGMRVCSGGIIGMGESMEQRIEMAIFLQNVGVKSIPINILSPIKNTPLENISLIDENDILRTIAIFRIINPKAYLRFSGGRARLNKKAQEEALRIGINSAIVGDLLTTIGNGVVKDFEMIRKAGYNLERNTDWEDTVKFP